MVYVFGSNSTQDKLYALDAGTGTLRYAQPVTTAPSAAVLGY
jgi:outer membrane protein assembly factor BamB